MPVTDKNLTALTWRVLAAAVISATLALADTHIAHAADRALIAKARHALYTNRNESLAILEDAVRRNPEEVAYWVEYIRALDGNESFADRASRHALKLHPRHPDLLIARARLHRNGVGLDALAELAKIPGYQRKAERLKDLLVCGLDVPESEPWPPETLVALADSLLVIGRVDSATRYVDEGLHQVSGECARPLLARRAMLAALNGEFERAMRLHASAGGTQVVIEYSYHGLADVLLVKNKPDMAIASLGRNLPTDDDSRRLLAVAKLRSNNADGALKLLAGDALEDQLLRCRALLSDGRTGEAKKLGREIVGPMEIQSGSHRGPWIGFVSNGPQSLVDDYLSVLRWLNKQFPKKRPEIEFELGCGTEEMPISPAAEPISQTIARLEAAMRTPADAAAIELVRTELSNAYEQVGRYHDAANLLTTSAPTYDTGAISYAWVRWSMLRRQAEALSASDKDYASLAAARPIIANARASRGHSLQANGQPGLSDVEVARRLAAIGPAVLADVMTQLGPNTISGEDRRLWVAVLEQLGLARDAPVLIATLALVTRPRDPILTPEPYQLENDRLTAAAIETCLEKLTRAKPEGSDRAIAWSKWWAGNVAQIVAGR